MTAVLLTLVVVLTPLCAGLAWNARRWHAVAEPGR